VAKPNFIFKSREYTEFNQMQLEKSDILFVGGSVDDRGESATGNLTQMSSRTVKLETQGTQLCTDGHKGNQAFSMLKQSLKPGMKVRIEATTLGLAEIIRVIQAAIDMGLTSVEFVYIEPSKYSEPGALYTETGLPQHRDFLLTTNRKFTGLSGFSHEHTPDQKAHHVFFLGFEPSRLEQAFQQKDDPGTRNYARTAVVGVPAFSPGWENNVFSGHAAALSARGFAAGNIRYCAANSPRDAYFLLWDIWRSVANIEDLFYVSPFGTKPHSVGAALFLVEAKRESSPTSLYYDHPERPKGRSEKIRRWHVWQVNFLGMGDS
jgi:hypothetical protein